MEFEWNEKKRKSNLARHGLDFKDAEIVFESDTTSFIDDRFDYGEIRHVSFGMLQDTVVAVVFTENEETTRIISFRKATRNEEKEYYKRIRN